MNCVHMYQPFSLEARGTAVNISPPLSTNLVQLWTYNGVLYFSAPKRIPALKILSFRQVSCRSKESAPKQFVF